MIFITPCEIDTIFILVVTGKKTTRTREVRTAYKRVAASETPGCSAPRAIVAVHAGGSDGVQVRSGFRNPRMEMLARRRALSWPYTREVRTEYRRVAASETPRMLGAARYRGRTRGEVRPEYRRVAASETPRMLGAARYRGRTRGRFGRRTGA